MKKYFLLFCFVLFVLLMYVLWCRAAFVIAFTEYRTASDEHLTYASAPAVEKNPVRNELNRVLSEVLARPMSDGERLSMAQTGIDLLNGMELQIDRMGESGEVAHKALEKAERAGMRLGNVFAHTHIRDIFLHAREQSAMIDDIRGLSYRANYHTERIFERIIEDGGSLTSEHLRELNSELPQVEEQFNKRSNLYASLQGERTAAHKGFDSLWLTDLFSRF